MRKLGQQKVTPEMIYSEWHKNIVLQKTGKLPRAIKNFDKAKFEINSAGNKVEKPDWIFFKKFAIFASRNTLVDYKVYMKALGEFYGYILPKNIANQKGLAIYKSYIAKNNVIKANINDVYKIINDNVRFVQKFCKENSICSLNEYLLDMAHLYPTVLRHYKEGNISPYFLACIKDWKDILGNYNSEFVEQSLGNLMDNFYEYEHIIFNNSKLKSLKNKFKKIIK